MNVIKLPINVFTPEALLYTLNEYQEYASFKIESTDKEFIVHYEVEQGATFSEKIFMNSLIENSVRIDILNKTKDTRKLILARAFSSTIIDQGAEQDNDEKEWDETDILNDWFDSSENTK